MKKYLSIYKTLLGTNLSALMIYRGNFYSSLFSSILFGALSILSIVLLTSKTSNIYGWKRDEIILISTVYSIVIGIFHTVLSRNFDRFSRIVNLGELDLLLTKPIDSQFSVSMWVFNYTSIARIILGVLLTWYMVQRMQLNVGLVEIASFVVLTIFGIVLLYSIWFLFTTITIWFTRLSNIVDLMYFMTGFARFPKEMYQQLTEFIFLFILPLSLVVTIPTKAILNRILLGEVGELIILTLGLFIATRMFWKFALRFYTSASS